MEPDEVQPALAAAVEEVLETMCFATALASAEGAAPREGVEQSDGVAPSRGELAAKLDFRGGVPGRFRISVPPAMAKTLAAGFLGRDEAEVTEPEAGEVLGELANMICGSLLSRLEGEATFQLSHPAILRTEASQEASGPGFLRWFDLGEGILTASVEFRPAA